MAKKTTTVYRCSMCGNQDCADTRVVNIYEGLFLCTDCIQFINEKKEDALKIAETEKVNTQLKFQNRKK